MEHMDPPLEHPQSADPGNCNISIASRNLTTRMPNKANPYLLEFPAVVMEEECTPIENGIGGRRLPPSTRS